MKFVGTVAAFLLALLLSGCASITDEQWDAFCPDGHCPIYKIGKPASEQARETQTLRSLPTIEEVRP